jgi:DNA-binding transcriptional ArsR family regulator
MSNPALHSSNIDPVSASVLDRAADVIRCLGHPLRLRILERLERGECSVSELQDYAGSTQVAVSQQLAALKAKSVVAARREGTRVHYRVVEPKVSAILACIRDCAP